MIFLQKIKTFFNFMVNESADLLLRHDLLNSLHGMKLFIHHRLDQKKTLTQAELDNLYQELVIMEELIWPKEKGSSALGLKAFMDRFYEQALGHFDDVQYQFSKNLPEEFSIGKEAYRVLSNILKNGLDHGRGVLKINCYRQRDYFRLEMKNQLGENDRFDHSFPRGLGLKSIHYQLRQVNGSLRQWQEGELYCVDITLPCVVEQNSQTRRAA